MTIEHDELHLQPTRYQPAAYIPQPDNALLTLTSYSPGILMCICVPSSSVPNEAIPLRCSGRRGKNRRFIEAVVARGGRTVRRRAAQVSRGQMVGSRASTVGRRRSKVVPLGRQRCRSARSAASVPRPQCHSASPLALHAGNCAGAFIQTRRIMRRWYLLVCRRNRVRTTAGTVTGGSWTTSTRCTSS